MKQHHIVDLEGIDELGFSLEKGHTVLDRCIDHGIAVSLNRNCFAVPFEQVLLDPAFFIEDAKRGRKTPRDVFDGIAVQAFLVDAVDANHDPQVSALGEEDLFVHEAEEISESIGRAPRSSPS